MNTHQQELPLGIRPKRRRRYSPAARAFFALGERLRREVEMEHLQKIHGRQDR